MSRAACSAVNDEQPSHQEEQGAVANPHANHNRDEGSSGQPRRFNNHDVYAPRYTFSGLGPDCFGPMIKGERYPAGFKGLRDVDKYEPSMDPKMWISNYG